MTATPNPQGINEADYESIEAAVTETVRGRWFLNEFARRTRAADTQTMLQAMARLEHVVTAAQPRLEAPPTADPSIRMLVQRIKEITGQLDETARAMREGGADESFCQMVGEQARAVAGLMRTGSAPNTIPPQAAVSKLDVSGPAAGLAPKLALPVASPADLRVATETRAAASAQQQPDDPRLPFLSGLDRLTLAQKTALFT